MAEREGFSGTSLLLAFLGGAVAGLAAVYYAAPELRAKVRGYALDRKERAGRIPKAIRDASSAAVDAFKETYGAQVPPGTPGPGVTEH